MTNENVSPLVDKVLERVRKRDRITVEDATQLAEDGIPVYKLLSKSIGKPIPEVRRLMERGEIKSGVVLEAIARERG